MPDQLKLGFALWTRDSVRELIRQRCDFDMPIRTLGEYLKRWDYTPQRPLKKAYQQKPEVVQRWLDTEYPQIERRAKAEGAEIHWGDETGGGAATAMRVAAMRRPGRRRSAWSVAVVSPPT